MKPVILSIIIGIAIVIVAAGFLSRDLPMEKIVADDYETITPIAPSIPLGEGVSDFSNSPATADICDKSYPDICIAPYPPDVDCDEIGFSNFRVTGSDPHGLDADNDGIGCEVGSPESANPVETVSNCDPSYPDVCIAEYPPDLDCGEISYSNFKVIGILKTIQSKLQA
jgi:hypothetical protein